MKTQLLHGDCLEVMKCVPDKSIDLVLTDPPYRDEVDNQPTMDMRKNGGMENFGNKLNKEQFAEIVRISKHQIIWGCNNFNFLPAHKGFLVWQKHIPENFTMSMAEIAYVSESLSTISKVFKIASNREKRLHPTQKPLRLFEWILEKYSSVGDTVLDCFMGSGTTGVACKKLNRNFIGIELDADYFKIASERIAKPVEVPLF
jgi:site-specific DNA-methyltransferase (adenine-specific)